MKTAIAPFYRDTAEGQEADAILRACVHCGLCTATCPTYRLLGDERDSPRGRIYLIKQILEGRPVGRITRFHLDRCLTCGSCETTCPSGVPYRRLLHLGRKLMDEKVPRPLSQRFERLALRKILPYPERLLPMVRLGQGIRPLLPRSLGRRLPTRRPAPATLPDRPHRHRVLILEGCVQSAITPQTNQALIRILDRIDIQVIHAPKAGCCGALSYHLGARIEAIAFMRRNIDAWWPQVEAGIQGIVISASGCAAVVREYGTILRHDPDYAHKAARIASLVQDPITVLEGAAQRFGAVGKGQRIAFHAPCTLQHSLRLAGHVERFLAQLGFSVTPITDAHLCCGGAGTYSLLQPRLSQRLLTDKLHHLAAGKPELIATANIGCQLHLQTRAEVPVRHWLELLA
uniref:Glycolate oxidase iron-sulfur subunit n=1 Tax=Candidatus Kentrum sp. MB TaxID=2138164 RepID=A0A450XC88_9GAMM|nr:MAG: glycolate oxidase iron-sulfur subunit [Candidatus Kentron sp. MB]VFK31165.1 MAG: glycolate oxidase iron-sulfur subunit [Candidatus Kentron sp. MB]VFK75372.1 MAG: glycolate oxidase iron-sulfur subunit [Candidatus Kentron sp. MB]